MQTFIKQFKDIRIADIPNLGGKNASLGEMYAQLSSEGIMVPDGFATTTAALNEQTKYRIKESSIGNMKKGVMLINTNRGGLVNTNDVVKALKNGQICFFGMDVHEEEEGLFFEDHSEGILQDDTIARLMAFQNVLITSHQAFLTDTALKNISETTVFNLHCFEKNIACENEVKIK